MEGLSPETATEMRVVLDSETERTWVACNNSVKKKSKEGEEWVLLYMNKIKASKVWWKSVDAWG
jgi:hypothetical protein